MTINLSNFFKGAETVNFSFCLPALQTSPCPDLILQLLSNQIFESRLTVDLVKMRSRQRHNTLRLILFFMDNYTISNHWQNRRISICCKAGSEISFWYLSVVQLRINIYKVIVPYVGTGERDKKRKYCQ